MADLFAFRRQLYRQRSDAIDRAGRRLIVQGAAFSSLDDRLGSVYHIQFAERIVQMKFDGSLGQPKDLTDFPIRLADGYPAEYIRFARGQRYTRTSGNRRAVGRISRSIKYTLVHHIDMGNKVDKWKVMANVLQRVLLYASQANTRLTRAGEVTDPQMTASDRQMESFSSVYHRRPAIEWTYIRFVDIELEVPFSFREPTVRFIRGGCKTIAITTAFFAAFERRISF
jgi:hypothetical protein